MSFDDNVTGKLVAFASRAKIVHADIDLAMIGKNKQPYVLWGCEVGFKWDEKDFAG